ncbi:uncharacterized protein LOC141825720 isoform X1 [Curcuma longa]|uniref:uncharacterized protein LOC141825720 isoform X1 n=1 Tax=Curcuma longa TaxID=136217 RepID=UPI003D9F39A3
MQILPPSPNPRRVLDLISGLGCLTAIEEESIEGSLMESSGCVGLMAVVAVCGGVALFAVQVHKRLASDFIKKFESEIGKRGRGRQRKRPKKKVTFAPDVLEPSADNEEYRRRPAAGLRRD